MVGDSDSGVDADNRRLFEPFTTTSNRGLDRVHSLVSNAHGCIMVKLELATKIRDRSPETRVLFMSGHTDDDGVAQGCREQEASLLRKPFIPSELLQAIRASLDHHELPSVRQGVSS